MEFALCFLVFLLVFSINQSKSDAVFSPKDNYLIDCGSNSDTAVGNRTFSSDTGSSSLSITAKGSIFANTTASNSGNLSGIYLTARVFTTEASYTFKIQEKGMHLVRLYFFPFSYKNYNLASANFSVATEEFGLLYNFGIQNGLNVSKEYLINLASDSLVLNFFPSNNSLAFINAIEVVSVPSNQMPNETNSVPSSPTSEDISSHALETVYRLNMGGPEITPDEDALWRHWQPDKEYLVLSNSAQSANTSNTIYYTSEVTQEIAPQMVYATLQEMANPGTIIPIFNISWNFSVDPNYEYFIRMHFCDFVSKTLNQFIFNVYINSDMAIAGFDISSTTNYLARPLYKDFVAKSSSGSNNLYVSIGPASYPSSSYYNAVLNGLEIMKMSNK